MRRCGCGCGDGYCCRRGGQAGPIRMMVGSGLWTGEERNPEETPDVGLGGGGRNTKLPPVFRSCLAMIPE